MNGIEPRCEWALAAELGEGPVWHPAERALYFVDIKRHKLHCFRGEGEPRQSWDAPAQIGFALPAADGSLLCGLQGGLYRFRADAAREQRFEMLAPVEPDRPGNRLNDGYVDADGNLWFGSMDDAENAPTGALYRVGADGAVAVRDSGYVITNGPAMSPDGRTLYHGDTTQRVVYAFDVGAGGVLHGKRPFATIAGTGYPDGITVDADGFVWIALFGGARVERYAPDGRLVGRVALPCPNVTNLAFGGDDRRTAYVTTARKGMSDDALRAHPLAGALFSFRAPAPGLPQRICRVTPRA